MTYYLYLLLPLSLSSPSFSPFSSFSGFLHCLPSPCFPPSIFLHLSPSGPDKAGESGGL